MVAATAVSTVHRRPGTPMQEARLTGAVLERPQDLLALAGAATVILEEVDLGIGRPDIILVAVDLAAVALRRSAGLRLSNLTEARALDAALHDDLELAGVTARHGQRLVARLLTRGWLGPFGGVVRDSMIIEAKVKDWGVGIHQLSRVRWAAHQAVLLLPPAAADRVPEQMLAVGRIGLLTTDERGDLTWRKAPPRRPMPFYVDAWLGELVIRQLETRAP